MQNKVSTMGTGYRTSSCHHFQATVVSLWTLTNWVTVTKTLSSWSQRLQNFALHKFFWNGNTGARGCFVGLKLWFFVRCILPHNLFKLACRIGGTSYSLILSYTLTLKRNPKITQVTSTGTVPDCLTEWMVRKEIFWP